MINSNHYTITWHVDNVIASNVDPTVNNEFHKWCKKTYRNDNIGHVEVSCEREHYYLEINLDWLEKSKLRLDMMYYIDNTMEECPQAIQSKRVG